MIYYKVGCNFDLALIDGLKNLNEINSSAKVYEVYGSDREHSFLAARPAFRLPNISMKYLANYVKKCINSNINFNYTLNSMYSGSKRFLKEQKKEIIKFIKFLEDIGVKTITVSNPLLAILVREATKNIEIEVSTIAHIDTITQIKAWKEYFNISKICNNLLKNRSFKFLKSASSYCRKNNIDINLMVNEFCTIGSSKIDNIYSTHCIYRDSHYLCHSENITKEDDMLFNLYPINFCIKARTHPVSWLQSLFIRPEDIKYYNRVGINHFKITGRTGNTDYILKITKAYLNQSWDGNLLALWKPLETILTDKKELAFKYPCYINNKDLNRFILHWINNTDHDCSIEVCGETCNYCIKFYNDNF